MALRIASAVIRGEIDNTTEGQTIGRLWLVGADDPVGLELVGDCWRDLAGARLRFLNPNPAGEPIALHPAQKGLVGDMTASRKSRMPTCDLGECLAREAAGEIVPSVWKNELYLEWFDDRQGRVLIESCDFLLELGESSWAMDADAEEAQKLANLQAMRDYLAGMIARPPSGARIAGDEFAWEQRLQQSDRLTDAYQEVLEKYMDDPDAERKEAFVMGWDGVLGAMAEEREQGFDSPEEVFDFSDEMGDDEEEDYDFESHPLQEEAQDLALRSIDLLRECDEHLGEAQSVMSALSLVAAKLAGALNGHYEREQGYVIAILKRCLDSQNEALASCGRLLASGPDAEQKLAIEALRRGIFDLRGKLTEMRRQLSGR
ncbi:hypothetical protein [Haloferula sargassicola]|uniref:Uncharacterized protein n=1 Tax=Haloferula sargassicola TaxID=490096 RepID=A0ABP9UU99_9BACT